MPKDFKPPKQVETHAYVFDRNTGEILATHTRWTDAGAEAQQDVGQDLLASIAKDSDRNVKDLDVLRAKPRAGQAALRVDVKTRKVTVDRVGKVKDLWLAAPPGRP